MTERAARYLYLARHGEALPDESGLSERGRRQAVLLGRRLAGRPLSVVHHGPLPRAAQTARLVCEQLDGVPARVSEVAGDYVPYVPSRAELPSDCADFLLAFLAQATAEERARGPRLAARAVERFAGPVAGGEERHELLVTHNFLIGWLVRHALDAPSWRWLGLNHGNASLTVIRWTPGRPATLLAHDDMSHLPVELRQSGFPAESRL
ncbi:histidine phosphatase family protein [Kitasatospora sp. NPDC059795]|uniref:histidine phosphatase family protein n=1 Tax=Kitasatospora sp. NPDC059795 TaxID=3346949 RepID=UPI003658A0DC